MKPKPKLVIDRNHKPIQVGQTVRVYASKAKATYEAKVVEVDTESPTVAEAGYWVEIDDGNEQRSMMSYLLEVLD